MTKKATASHTVPACYLANFGVNGNEGRNSTVYFLNTLNGSKGMQSINHFPVENSFYDLSVFGLDPQILEKSYSQVEGEFAELLRNLLSAVEIEPSLRKDSVVCFPNDDKAKLSALLALQITRTRAFRERYEDVFKQLEDKAQSVDFPQYGEDDFKRIHLEELVENKMSNFFANVFDDRHWVVLINHTDVPFCTSDNPVVVIDNRKNREQRFNLLSKETSFFFPVSPQVAIEIYHKEVAKMDFIYFDLYRGQNVRRYNAMVKSQCSRFVISNKPIIQI